MQNETGEEKRPIRDKKWHPKNETRYMTEALTQSSGVSPTPREPSITAAAGVMFLPYFGQDESMTYNFSQCTNFSATDDGGLINCCHCALTRFVIEDFDDCHFYGVATKNQC